MRVEQFGECVISIDLPDRKVLWVHSSPFVVIMNNTLYRAPLPKMSAAARKIVEHYIGYYTDFIPAYRYPIVELSFSQLCDMA